MSTPQEVRSLPVSKLDESPGNPRKLFGDLSGLSESIKAHGIQQPIVARAVGERFEIVFGHRRFRAAKQAGLKSVPVIVRELGDVEVAEQQLIENLQREDVHPLELAAGYRAVLDKGVDADTLAARVGVSRSSVYAALKLLDLVEPVQKAFLAGRLEAAHARAIARVQGERLQVSALRDVEALASRTGTKASTKQVERLVQKRYMGTRSKAERKRREAAKASPEAQELAVRARRDELLTARVVAELERKAAFDDVDLRTLLLALGTTHDDVGQSLASQGVRLDRLSTLRGARLRGLLGRSILAAWLGADDAAAGALARTYRIDLSDMQATAQALVGADGVLS